MYSILEESELFVLLVFTTVGVLIFGDFFLFKTIPWNVNPKSFSIEEGWQNRCYLC